MIQSVKATYKDGVLQPSESLDLEDGDVVMLSIWVEASAEDGASASVDGNGEMDDVDGEQRVGTRVRKRGTLGVAHDARNP